MRCIQPSEYLLRKGWLVDVGCIYRNRPKDVRVAVLHRVSCDSHTRAYIEYFKARGAVIVYDVDDLLFGDNTRFHVSSFHCPESQKKEKAEVLQRYRDAMLQCDVVFVSTSYLKSIADQFHRDVRLMRNGLSREMFSFSKSNEKKQGQENKSHYVTIGYLSGSKHHDGDFAMVQDALLQILNNKANARLLVMGKLHFSDAFSRFGDRFVFRDFVPYKEFRKIFSEIDINLVPLDVSNPFNHARSELKYIEAGAFGIPTVASYTQTYTDVIRHGDNGLLANSEDWYEVLASLIDDPDLRQRLGDAARSDVQEHYSPERKEEEWDVSINAIIEQYADDKNRQRMREWICFAHSMYRLTLRRVRILLKERGLLARCFGA